MSGSDSETITSTPRFYDVSGVLPITEFDRLPAGTNVLIKGSSLLGADRIALELLSRGDTDGEAKLLVTTDSVAPRIRSRYDELGSLTESESLQIVDCSGISGKGSMHDTDGVKYASSPGDLTGIGIGIVKTTNDLGPRVRTGLRYSIVSLSTILRYADAKRVFNFLHVISGRIDAAGHLGIATLDPTQFDERTVNSLLAPFDVVVDLKERGDEREVRVIGTDNIPRTWTPY